LCRQGAEIPDLGCGPLCAGGGRSLGAREGQDGTRPGRRGVMSGHLPVMLSEVLEMLQPRDGAHYVDGTFGGGGYASAILEAADCKVLGIDRDPDAIARGQALVERFGG